MKIMHIDDAKQQIIPFGCHEDNSIRKLTFYFHSVSYSSVSSSNFPNICRKIIIKFPILLRGQDHSFFSLIQRNGSANWNVKKPIFEPVHVWKPTGKKMVRFMNPILAVKRFGRFGMVPDFIWNEQNWVGKHVQQPNL